MHIKDELPFGNKTHRVAVWKGPQFGFDRVQLIAVASAGRCEQAAEEPPPPSPACPRHRACPGLVGARRALWEPGDLRGGTAGTTGCSPHHYAHAFLPQLCSMSARLEKVLESPGKFWEVSEGSRRPCKVIKDCWGQPGTGWHLQVKSLS